MQESKLMTRRHLLWIAWALAACRGKLSSIDVFPENIGGVWRRTSLRDMPISEAPDPVPRTSVRRLQTAKYEGPGQLEVRCYELTSAGAGLDMVQRWRPSADTVFFSQQQFFIVVRWQQAERKALQDFVRELEKRLGPQGSGNGPL
jgi:hypothetical protein